MSDGADKPAAGAVEAASGAAGDTTGAAAAAGTRKGSKDSKGSKGSKSSKGSKGGRRGSHSAGRKPSAEAPTPAAAATPAPPEQGEARVDPVQAAEKDVQLHTLHAGVDTAAVAGHEDHELVSPSGPTLVVAPTDPAETAAAELKEHELAAEPPAEAAALPVDGSEPSVDAAADMAEHEAALADEPPAEQDSVAVDLSQLKEANEQADPEEDEADEKPVQEDAETKKKHKRVRKEDKVRKCVQCGGRFKEAENNNEACSFHPGRLGGSYPNLVYSCCSAEAETVVEATTIEGCKRGGHAGSHHRHYPYHRYHLMGASQAASAKEVWCQLSRPDQRDGKEKTVTLGLVSDDLMFISFQYDGYYDFFGLLGTPDMVKPKRRNIFRIQHAGHDWYMAAEWNAVDQSIRGVRLFVKAASDPAPTVALVQLVSKVMPLRAGEPVIESGKPQQPLTLPRPVQIGPSIPVDCDRKAERNKADAPPDASFTMSQWREVEADQTASSKERSNINVFHNYVKVEATRATTILSATVEVYRSGYWQAVPDIKVGTYSFWRKQYGALPLKLDAGKSKDVVVSAMVPFHGRTGSTYDKRARAHPTLPNPLNLRVTLKSDDDKEVSLRTQQVNRPLNLPTAKQVASSRGVTLAHWQHCDDVDHLTRSFLAAWYDATGVLHILTKAGKNKEQLHQFGRPQLESMSKAAVAAQQENTSVEESDVFSVKLVTNVAESQPHGFLVKITTGSGKSFGSFLVDAKSLK